MKDALNKCTEYR